MKSRIERIEHIRNVVEALKGSDKLQWRTHTISSWKGKNLTLPIVRIDADYLMFRIENTRTYRQQLKYLRSHPESPINLFEDAESSAAQEAQASILLEMIDSSGQEFVQDLNDRGQEDPAIITYDGFIVNGNRRTAALREKLGEEFIDCVVLPQDASAKDIYALEQELQISREFKEDYHWINELNNITNGLRNERYLTTEDQLARRLRIKKSELRSKIAMMDLVDSFLNWKQIPNQHDYTKLDDAEQVFKEIEKAQRKYSNNDHMRQELTYSIFHLVEERPEKGRLYDHVRALIRDFEQVYEKMKSSVESPTIDYGNDIKDNSPNIKEGNDPNSNQNDSETEQTVDILDEILEDNPVEEPKIFQDTSSASDMSAMLVETIADVKAENRERKDAEAVYTAVSTALRELQGLKIEDSTAKITSINNKLGQIIKVSTKLLNEVQKRLERKVS
ncbi:MAG: hypothetical protein H6653_14225 [Ardenticatenaceae bacterium]|nr:hypothetical protein [Ardenticatenaceae bacterium]